MRKQIKDHEIGPLYFFYGAEGYLRDHYLSMIKDQLIDKDLESFNYHYLDGKGITLQTLRDSTESVPFLSERKLVCVRDFDLGKIPASERDAWSEFFRSLPDYICLVFWYDLVSYKTDKRSKLYSAINEKGLEVEFEYQDTARLISWITRHFSARGKNISRENCEYFLFRCGVSMVTLSMEIEKIGAYCQATAIGKKDIDAVAIPVIEAVSFDLTDAVCTGKTKEAAEILQKLQWMREPPEVILGTLAKTLRGLYTARLALDYRKPVREVMEICRYRSLYPAEKLMRAAGRRTKQWCADALELCREADAQIKGAGDRDRALEWLLAGLCADN